MIGNMVVWWMSFESLAKKTHCAREIRLKGGSSMHTAFTF